jgi:glutamate-5-semialdehyde dehydrogenase
MTRSILDDAILAKAASRILARLDSNVKNEVLQLMAAGLEQCSEGLLGENQQDVQSARQRVSAGLLSSAALERLTLNADKLSQMAVGIRAVAALEDPVARILLRSELDDNLELKKITCPFGVVAAIVEARPDAVAQLSALALKSGNALMIKAGEEISRTTDAMLAVFRNALETTHIPIHAITNVQGREAVHELLGLREYVDLVIPRGGAELVRFVSSNTTIPVLGHSDGVCHIYVEASADQEMAIALILDSKIQAPSTCNAVETVLLDQAIANDFVPQLVERLRAYGVKVRGCEATRALAGPKIEAVSDTEWHTEYSDLTLAVRVVSGVDAALEHIERFGSHHTDSIVTRDERVADRFLREVDSAGVFHNVSTRFSDGYRYGFGAEVGISTGKLHARGPVGLDGLLTYKYVLSGAGHCVSEYVGPRAPRSLRHQLAVQV